jgi:osmotically-inducible protein OsmY
LLALALLGAPLQADGGPDDATLARAVVDRLDRDPRLRTFDVDVEVHDAVVVLRGSVPTLADAHKASRIASDVRGVGGVESRLDLATRGRPDREIEFELRDRFQNNGDLAEAKLAITVRGGVALLTGTVVDPRVRAVAQRVAASVPGVLGIADEIRAPDLEENTVRGALNRRRMAD